MLESLNTDVFEYEKLKPEEMQKRGILGRLIGIMADTVNPTRNGRSYSSELWENVFNNPIMKERIENNCCFGELGHPSDREETDMTKIAICMDGLPKKDKNGKLRAVFNILDTPNGRILKSLCDYGCNIGISSRGSGDLITDFDGNESVDPDTYNCEGWDAVIIPAVKEARLTYVTEALEKKRYNKSLRDRLQEAINKETEDNKKVMTESLSCLGISLNEDSPDIDTEDIEMSNSYTPESNTIEKEDKSKEEKPSSVPDEESSEEDNENDFFYKGVEIIKDPNSGKFVCKIEGDSYSFNSIKNAKIWVDINGGKSVTKSTDIRSLPHSTQQDIENTLSKILSSDDEVKKAMHGKLSNLDNLIDVNKYITEEQVGRDEVKDDKNIDDVLKPETEEETSTEETKKEEDKVTITISEANGNDPHVNVKLEKPYRALIFDNGEISISSIRPYDDGDYYYANYNGNSEGIFYICQNGKVKEKIKVDLSDRTFKDVVNRLKELDSKINPRMLYDSLNESIDWTSLNSTEQFAAESAISYIKENSRIANDLNEIESVVSDAVSMYNEANAFDEYSDEDFYEEEAEYSKVLKYVLQQLGLYEESNLTESYDNVTIGLYGGDDAFRDSSDFYTFIDKCKKSGLIILDNSYDEYGNWELELSGSGEIIYKLSRDIPGYNNMNLSPNEWIDEYKLDESLQEDIDDINAARMQLCQVLDDWYRDNIANERAEDIKLSGWDADLQSKYLDFRNYLAPDLIKDKEDYDFYVDNIESEIDSLHEMLNHNKTLEKQIIELNEKLSVSHAMEKSLKVELRESKEKILKLSKISKENKVLTEQLTAVKDSTAKLNESKQNYISKIKSLQEQLSAINKEKLSQTTELDSLREDYELLNRDLIQTKEQFSKKFEKQNNLLEKYQKITKNAVDRYISMQATNLGVKPVEIKNKLSESFTFNEIDTVCEDLRKYKLNVSRLPFNTSTKLNENISITANNVGRNSLIPRNEVDELSDYDLKLMEAYL